MAPRCDLRMKESTLPGTINRKRETEMIYTPLLHLNISALSPALQEFQGYITTRKSMSAQTKETTPQDKVFETNDKSLEHLEQQLYDFSLARRAGSSQTRMIHGSYLGLALLSVGLLIYSSYPVLKRMAIRKQRRLLKTRIDQGDDPSLVSIRLIISDSPNSIRTQLGSR